MYKILLNEGKDAVYAEDHMKLKKYMKKPTHKTISYL